MDMKTTFKESQPENFNTSPAIVFNEMEKSCINCHTTRTPLWRGGPAGPRSLCNACGIRYRKAKRTLLGFDKQRAEKRKRKTRKGTRKLGVMLKMGGKMLLQRSLGEEEQAALLLMALSCGYVYAQGKP